MTYRVLLADSLGPEGFAKLTEQTDLEIIARTDVTKEQLPEALKGVQGLVVRSRTKVTADALKFADDLRVIGRAGIGVDNIDVEAATKRGIVVMNTPGGSNVTTAEHAVAMLMALARNIPQAHAAVRAGTWPRERWIGTELCNKVLGVVGMGNIGSVVAERALGLRMKVIAFDPFVTPEMAARLRVELVSLDDLIARSDFITLHTPLTPETKGLLGREALARTKKGVRIVNCARGGIVDEDALVEAIKSGHVAGAALDVFVQEPPPKDHPLLQLEQVIVTPHLGASTGEAQVNVAVAVAQQVADFLVNGTILNAVNAPSISPEALRVLRPYLFLTEKLGALAGQLTTEAPQELQLQASGDIAQRDVRSLATAATRGLLAARLDTGVNYVNAPAIAKERGIRIVEARTPEGGDYVNAILVQVKTASGTSTVEGAVFAAGMVRITRINGYKLEAEPNGHIIMCTNRDVPGVVGRIGTLLGESGINIGNIVLGRQRIGGMALSLIHVDDVIPETVIAKLRQLPEIVSAQLLRL